ncbi:hypothetical protein KR222_008503 [Zaprionus bogoriensis]|nr:hypothetical protein KR222_008503 [Zaprionus bogoriensis]
MANYVAKLKTLANKLATEARPLYDEFMCYARVELSPPTPADFKHLRRTAEETAKKAKTAKKDVKSTTKRFGQVTVAEAWLNTLVFIEVITWFYMGEVIGRRHLVGYKV